MAEGQRRAVGRARRVRPGGGSGAGARGLACCGRVARHVALLGAGARGLVGVVSARLVKAADHGAEDPPLSLNSSRWLGAALLAFRHLRESIFFY